MGIFNGSCQQVFRRNVSTFIYIAELYFEPIFSSNFDPVSGQKVLFDDVDSCGFKLLLQIWLLISERELLIRRFTLAGIKSHWKCAKLLQTAASTCEVGRHCVVQGFRDHSHSTLGFGISVTVMVEFVWTYPQTPMLHDFP